MCQSVRRRTTALVGFIGLVSVVAAAGGLIAPTLIGHHALLLALLAPKSPYVAAAALQTPFRVMLPVCLIRLSVCDSMYFVLGRMHGSSGMRRVGRHLPFVTTGIARHERLLRRVGAPVAGLVPTGPVMAGAGALGVGYVPAMACNLVGTALRVSGICAAARIDPELTQLFGHVVATVMPVVGITACVAAVVRHRLRRTRASAQHRHPATAVFLHAGVSSRALSDLRVALLQPS